MILIAFSFNILSESLKHIGQTYVHCSKEFGFSFNLFLYEIRAHEYLMNSYFANFIEQIFYHDILVYLSKIIIRFAVTISIPFLFIKTDRYVDTVTFIVTNN